MIKKDGKGRTAVLRIRAFKWCLIFGCLFFMLGNSIKAHASGSDLQITLMDLKTENSGRENVEVLLYRVGDTDEEGKPVLLGQYGIESYPTDAASLDEAAIRIAGKIEENPIESGRTGPDGTVVFSNLDDGVYLAVIPEGNPYGKVTPFLISLPCVIEADGVRTVIRNVRAEPKASPYQDEGDDDGGSDGGGESDGGSENGGMEQQTRAVRTGDENFFWLWLLLAAAALTGIILARRK